MTRREPPQNTDTDDTKRERQQNAQRTLTPEMATPIAQLMLLYGVPFEHLVPDWRMLPPNSIRWFHLDQNWLDSLLDGAFSVGAHSERDVSHHHTLDPLVKELATQAAPALRPKLLENVPLDPVTVVNEGEDARSTPSPIRWCGFLMRSPLVAGWPGLEISAAATDGTPIDILRLERLTPDIMLAIFVEPPHEVIVREPAEDLHFGVRPKVEDEGSTNEQPAYTVEARKVLNGTQVRKRVDTGFEHSVDVTFRRDAADGVLDVSRLVEDLETATERTMTPSEFAAHMIIMARYQRFTPEGEQHDND